MDTIAFVRASLNRMLDESTKALPESLLWEIAEKMPELSDLATKVIVTRYPGESVEVNEPLYTVVAMRSEASGEREGEAIDRLAELLDDGAATIGSLPDEPGRRQLLSSLKRARKYVASRDNVANRAHRFAKLEGKTMLPRYPRMKVIRHWETICEAIASKQPMPCRPTELPLCLEDYARRAMNRLRKQLIRTGKMDRQQVKMELERIAAQADRVPLSQFVAEARIPLMLLAWKCPKWSRAYPVEKRKRPHRKHGQPICNAKSAP